MEGNSGLDFLAQIDPDTVEYTMQLVRAAKTASALPSLRP